MNEISVAAIYRQQIEKHKAALEALLKKRSRLGWTRLAVFLLTLFIAYQIFTMYGFIGLVPTVTGLAVLLWLISTDTNNNKAIANVKILIRINEEELQTLEHRFFDKEDGSRFTPPVHDYAADLDVFGKSSLYQFINRGYTEGGRTLLAHDLLSPLPLAVIKERQTAVKEIAADYEWRHQLQAFAMQTEVLAATQQKAEAWLAQPDKHFTAPAWKAFVLMYTVVTCATAIAAITDLLPAGLFSALYLLYIVTASALSAKATRSYTLLSGIVKEIATIRQLIEWIEAKSFSSPLLVQLVKEAEPPHQTAAGQLKALNKILDRFDMRLSIFGWLVLNPFMLWDLRQMIALNTWRKKNGALLTKWFELVAQMEVLNSLATLHFNNPDWCFPVFADKHFTLAGLSIGHPLIPAASRVVSDFTLEGPPKIGLITGSNMAGKSTFLRSLGVNVVLAQMGAPVCAQTFTLSPVYLMSSMRIADNLAENTSTFYAELKKLKTIIEAVNERRSVFILLDEILRGTNSLDRHTGSAALVRQLIQESAVAVIATHDVELAALQETFPESIENYHFDVQVSGEELYFDYQLKHGVCTSLNASILMKKIGIRY